MKRIVIALAVGLALGLGATAWLLGREAGDPEVQPAAALPARAASASPTAPGLHLPDADRPPRALPALVVHVVHAGAASPGHRVTAWVRAGATFTPIGAELTDAQGNASFPAQAGRYALSVAGPDGKAVVLTDVPVSDEPTVVEVPLGATAQARGRVLDEATKAGLAGAMAFWVPHDAQVPLPRELAVASPADGLGRFSFPLPAFAGTAVLEARAAGYARGEAWWSADAPVDVALVRAAVVAGLVLDEAGQPVPGALIRSRPEEDVPRSTDAQGRFTLQVPAGGATVHAVGPGGAQATSRVRLSPGQRAALTLVLTRGSTLEGMVRDGAGAPVAAEVRVLSEPDEVELAHLTSAASGAFTVPALPEGRYSVLASTGPGSFGRAVGIEHPSHGLVEVKVLPAASLAGLVTNGHGEPLAQVTVKVSRLARLGEVDRLARTGDDGTFELAGLLPGEVTVDASLGEAAGQRRTVFLPGGERTVVELALGATGTLVGHVKRTSGGPPQVWSVLVGGPTGSWQERTDPEGHFTVALPAGTYSVIVNSMHRGKFIPTEATVRPNEVTDLVVPVDDDGLELDAGPQVMGMFPEVGTGVSFENSTGGVRVSFLMQDCPAALAGVKLDDLVVAIDGSPVRDSLDAFARLRARAGTAVRLQLRRAGADAELTLR